jgi:hypothetical protein
MVRRRALAEGFDADRVRLVSPRSAVQTVTQLAAALPADTILWGVGNFHGPGAQIAALFERGPAAC